MRMATRVWRCNPAMFGLESTMDGVIADSSKGRPMEQAISGKPAPQKSKNVTLSVQKALRLLSAFSAESPELSLMELAHQTGQSVSTTHRLLATLETEGFLERSPGTAHYRLAIKMFELGSIVLHRMELNIVGTPILARLSTLTEETTYLSVLSANSVLCVSRIEGVRHLRSQFLEVGRHLPLHAGAASKVLLAYQPAAQAAQMLSQQGLTSFTDRTITDPNQVLAALSQVREQGYALSDEEITRGITAIAAPVRDHSGMVIAAVSLSGAAERFRPPARTKLIEQVMDAAYQISIRLGFMPKMTL